MNGIVKSDCLELIKTCSDYEFDIVYSDPPYALGSEIVIREDGKVDYKKAVDFMNKWKMPGGDWWEEWFKESYRVLKCGGYCIMFGMDRQLLMPKYYAHLAGFKEKQSIYWYFLQNFPKSSDLSKNIEKNLKVERKKIGGDFGSSLKKPNEINKDLGYRLNDYHDKNKGKFDITESVTELGKKYDGYKYSISPLKQTNETIMVFQKDYKTGSCLHDTLTYEKGDLECCCGALNIDGGRVSKGDELGRMQINSPLPHEKGFNDISMGGKYHEGSNKGRYPAQSFIDSGVADILDRQSGNVTGGSVKQGTPQGFGDENTLYGNGYVDKEFIAYNDDGGCSKILHKCDFEKEEHDLYVYCSKVSGMERDSGLEEFGDKVGGSRNDSGRSYKTKCRKCEKEIRTDGRENRCVCEEPDEYYPEIRMKNNHPTLKPIKLSENVLKLFKTPNPQKILYPFAGAGSEIIGGIRVGFNDWKACEINADYIKIAEARIKYWSENEIVGKRKVGVKKSKVVGNREKQEDLFDF
jgi:DNA modification methylase